MIQGGRERASDVAPVILREDGQALIEEQGSLGAILLTPDYPVHGSFEVLRQWLSEWQCEIVGAIPLILTPSQIAHLYNGRASHEGIYPANRETWHPHRSRVLSGQSVYVFLRSANCADLQRTIATTKGQSSHPAPGSFRAQSTRTERYFSLAHCPDSPDDLRFEWDMLFGDAAALVRALDAAQPIPVSTIEILFHGGSIPSFSGRCDAVYGAVSLALCRLAGDPRARADRGTALEMLDRLVAAGTDASPELSGLADLAAEWRTAELGEEPKVLSFPDDCERLSRARLCAALRYLCRPRALAPTHIDAVAESFLQSGVALERWTLHRLHLYASFHGDRALFRDS